MKKYGIFVALVFVITSMSAVHGNTVITYCIDNATLGLNDTFEVCGNSPVLNPGLLNCQNYTRHMEEVCAAGCDPKNGSCTPLALERSYIVIAIFIMVLLFIVYVARRYG